VGADGRKRTVSLTKNQGRDELLPHELAGKDIRD